MSVSIKFQNWTILATSTILGQQHDHNSQTVTVTGDIPTGWDWYLLLGLGDQYNAYLMSQQNETLTVLLDETALPQSGPYRLQLKGVQLEDPSIIRHTNATTVLVEESITGDGSWPESIGQFTQIEDRIQAQAAQITQQANNVQESRDSAVSACAQAQAYLAETQTARNETIQYAQDIQSTLNHIYTKPECDNQFAHALVTASEKGTTHEIYPDAGSNTVITAYGYTEQAGEGTPSPHNVRPIQIGGRRYRKVMLNGEEPYYQISSATGGLQPYTTIRYPGVIVTSATTNSRPGNTSICNQVQFGNPYNTDGITFSCYRWGDDTSRDEIRIRLSGQPDNIEDARKIIKDAHDAGHPYIFWLLDDSASTLYIPIETSGTVFVNTCLPIRKSLCAGDYVSSHEDGKCMESHSYGFLSFTGEESWSTGADGRIYTTLPDSKEGGTLYCSHAIMFDGDPGHFSVSSGSYLSVSPGGQWGEAFHDLTSWKDYLSTQMQGGTPVTVVYQLKTPISYTSTPIELIAQPDSSGKYIIQSTQDISVTYNHSVSHAIQELKSAILAMGVQLPF